MRHIDDKAARRIEAAFAQAQARTGAPLACVVAQSSADYALAPTLGAAVLAMFAPWPLILLTSLPASRIFLFQLVLYALLLGLLTFAPLRAALASRARRRSAGFRAALVQFSRLGFAHAPERKGALLYLSLTERYARVVSDAEISQADWRVLIDELGAALRKGDATGALENAARRMGELLSPVSPPVPGADIPNVKRFHLL